MRDIEAAYNQLFKSYDVLIMPTIKYTAPLLPKAGISVDGNK
jgi:Asp-tRNA(Asn)/Glu-tRNA(Gln) amidotransferase A subunit family amidase